MATVFLTTLTGGACWVHLRPFPDAVPEAEAPPKPRTVSYVYHDDSSIPALEPET
jgi:hypothetical protein